MWAMPQTDVELIGAGQAAHLLGISRNTLTRRIEDGTIPTLGKLPGKNGALVFRRSDVERLAAEQTRAGAA